jgi:Zn-dependent protease
MALAGPTANFLLVVLAAIVIRVGLLTGLMMPAISKTTPFSHLVEAPNAPWLAGIATFVSILFSLNVILCFFNLLPVPPLDGAAIPTLFLARRHSHRLMETLWNPNYSIFGLLIAWNVFAVIIGPLYGTALKLLFLGVKS